MGVRTFLVIADAEAAQAVADCDDPATDRDGFTFNGCDRVHLCTLLSLLDARGPYVEFDRYLDSIEVITPLF